MGLSNDLLSQFAKITNDDKKTKKENIVYGTTKEINGKLYVQIDGSELYTPVISATNSKEGERVTVMIKNHTATITGNVTSPTARLKDIDEINEDIVTEVYSLVAERATVSDLNAEKARIDSLVSADVVIRNRLDASEADIDTLQAENMNVTERLTASEAEIDYLKSHSLDAEVANVTYATVANLNALDAEVNTLESNYADFKTTTTNKLAANEAAIEELSTNKLSASDIEGKYANIDFSNIGKAAIEYFFAQSGLIKNVVVGDSTVTGELVGVTIKGDLIEGNTVVADKLVIKGNDGLYYKLNTDGVTTEAEQTDYNSLNGQIIKAKSITASKVSVDDLVAFGATIGGFNITESSIHSGVKESVDNTTSGVYMDKDGQLALGDASSFIKYYRDQNGEYHLEISAQSVLMSTSTASEDPQTKTIEQAVEELTESIVTAQSDIDTVEERLSNAVSTAASDATEKANSALASAKAYADSQIEISANGIISTVSSTYTTKAEFEARFNEPKILWGDDLTSGMCMTAGHTANLKEAVSAQRHGIVLVFCAYDGTDDTNYSWQSFFVPKQLVALSTAGHTFVLGRGKFTYTGTKYLYINDTSITGHADNDLTGSNSGITYANNKFVLRYVIGV